MPTQQPFSLPPRSASALLWRTYASLYGRSDESSPVPEPCDPGLANPHILSTWFRDGHVTRRDL